MSVDFVAIKLALDVSGFEFSYLWVKASLPRLSSPPPLLPST